MKEGVFIYQKPPSLFTGVVLGAGTYGVLGLKKGINLRKQFIEKINNKLTGFITVTEDSTGANLEEVAAGNYDFIICAPGLQKIVTASKELPPIIYTDSFDFHKTEVTPTINQILNLFED